MSGIVVTGPPRSGTSAVTRLLDLYGLHVCVEGDQVGGGPNNPTGHWESKTVLAANNRLLDQWGVRWWCPPPPGYAAPVGDAMAGAAAGFRATHPREPWLCKDPRFASTLPVWRDHLDDLRACVIVLRRPDEVVASLRRTWPLTVDHATAIWMRYLHTSCASCAGVPTAVVRFPAVLDDVGAALAPVRAGLQALGVDTSDPAPVEVDRYVQAPRGTTGEVVRPEAWGLWDELGALSSSLTVGASIGSEDPFVESVLGPLREDLRAGQPIDTRPSFARAGDVIG